MTRRFRTHRSSNRRRFRRRSKSEGATIAILAILAGLGFLADSHPELTASLVALAILIVIFILYAIRRRSAAYRQALLECGARNPMHLSPVDFERFCGILLAGRGWSVKTTRTTGDFGADIVAERDGVRLVVQCKRWSNAAGVTAVQEAHAAISFYKAHRSAVMATGGFTRAAKALASTTGTVLIVPGRHDLDRPLRM